jgi:hypothetical protein
MENSENETNNVYYNYPIKNILVKDIDLFDNIDKYSKIILCVYKINTSGKFPFLQYLLLNNGHNSFTLPVIPIRIPFSKNNLISYSKVFLSSILQVVDFEDFSSKIEFDGFYEYSNNLYLFFDISICENNIDETYSYSSARFALCDEILNHRGICNMPISYDTSNFFLKNKSVNYIYDTKNEAYEIPIVGYVGKPTPEKINFVFTFGESAKNKSAILGPHFYFTDFYHAIRQGGWSKNYESEYMNDKLITDNEHGRYVKGGVIRFALFAGKTKYIENMLNTPNDESEIKNQRLVDSNVNQTHEMLTLRISDHDGLWSKEYDSAYLCNIELDNGCLLEEPPMLVIKEYNQQTPLSFHYIDKNKLDKKFNSNDYSYRIV